MIDEQDKYWEEYLKRIFGDGYKKYSALRYFRDVNHICKYGSNKTISPCCAQSAFNYYY